MSRRWPHGYPKRDNKGRVYFEAPSGADRLAAGRRREDKAFAYLGLKPPLRGPYTEAV